MFNSAQEICFTVYVAYLNCNEVSAKRTLTQRSMTVDAITFDLMFKE